MIATLLGLLPTVWKAAKIIVPGLILGALLAYGVFLYKDREVLKVQATQAESIARQNDAAVKEITAAKAASELVVGQMAAAQEDRQAAFNLTRKEILSAPNASTCISSPPVRSLLNGLRKGPAAPP